MPITYTPAKTATQAPDAPAAPNGPNVLDAVDYNTINEGVSSVTTFANTLEVSIGQKANTADVESGLAGKVDTTELANYNTSTEVDEKLALKADVTALSDYLTAADAATTYATKAELDDKADVDDLASYMTTTDAEATFATQANLTSGLATKADSASITAAAFAATAGCEYDSADSNIQAALDAIVARIAALEGA